MITRLSSRVSTAATTVAPASSVEVATPQNRAAVQGNPRLDVSKFRTAELPSVVSASENVAHRPGTSPGTSRFPSTGYPGSSGLPRDPYRFGDTNADSPEVRLPDLNGGLDWERRLRIPGTEKSFSWGSAAVACITGGVAGATKGGWAGAAIGCAVGVAVSARDDIAGNVIDAVVKKGLRGAIEDFSSSVIEIGPAEEEQPPPPPDSSQDGGVPMGVSDPKSNPNPDAEESGGRPLKFGSPGLAWQPPVRLPLREEGPAGLERNESSDSLRFLFPLADPNPDADRMDDGAALRSLLSSADAVTDPRWDASAQATALWNTVRQSSIRS